MPDEKRRIGVAATTCLRDGETVGMNDGSTVIQVARRIVDTQLSLTVATNALNVALALLESGTVEVTVMGGLLRRASFATYAPAGDELAGLRFDTVVLGIAGMTPETGITMHHPFDMVSARRLIERADRVIVVADSTKWSAGGYAHVAGWDKVNILVTDALPPETLVGASTEVIVADAD
jgi:DeoR family transcriptional regulator of aga operon